MLGKSHPNEHFAISPVTSQGNDVSGQNPQSKTQEWRLWDEKITDTEILETSRERSSGKCGSQTSCLTIGRHTVGRVRQWGDIRSAVFDDGRHTVGQTCAKVPKRFEILGSLSPRSGTLMDLGPCTSFLPWDSGNPGPQNCVMPQDPGNPGPEDFDMQ